MCLFVQQKLILAHIAKYRSILIAFFLTPAASFNIQQLFTNLLLTLTNCTVDILGQIKSLRADHSQFSRKHESLDSQI